MATRTMMAVVRILRVVVGIAGSGSVILGLLFWFAHVNLISFHMIFGSTFAATILALSAIALTRRRARLLGALGAGYAVLLPLFGLTQSRLLVGGAHWVVQLAHLLFGLGAMGLAQVTTRRLRQRATPPAMAASASGSDVAPGLASSAGR